MIKYLSPGGIPIPKEEWKKRDVGAYELRKYENDRISICVRAAEFVERTEIIPRNLWKIVRVEVENIISTDYEGNPIPKKIVRDTDASKHFTSLAAAIKYTDYLIDTYTESYIEYGVLHEVGNKYTPPPPPNPDMPTVAEDSPVFESFGSW